MLKHSVVLKGSPPRGRGKGPGILYSGMQRGITPAWAGKRHSMHQRETSAKDHPRVGGEKGIPLGNVSSQDGSPPRGRGKVLKGKDATNDERITPAWAGKRKGVFNMSCKNEDHPRVGGEKPQCRQISRTEIGSPPRGRGKVKGERKNNVCVGITPAWAGKSAEDEHPQADYGDHPRVGGEKFIAVFPSDQFQGSPPRGRGKDLLSV